MDELFSGRWRERILLAILFGAGALRFVNLGFVDLQAWDEALYAVRAEGILVFGGVLDQTSFSIGGLYSSLHPPLSVWLSSLAFLLFGVNEFAARFFSALLGGATLFIIYRIGKDLENSRVGFLAAMLYGLNPFVSFFARQGQFDTTLAFFLTLAIFFYLRMERLATARWGVYAGLSIGAALMTKLFVGFGIPLTYFLWKAFAVKEEERTDWRPFALSIGVVLLTALPWHVYLTVVRGFSNPFFFLEASAIVDRSVAGVEGNVKPLEAFYFVNQLVVLFPLGIVWFMFGFYRIVKERSRDWMLIAAWFTVFFVVFSLMRTKLSVYALPMLIPAALIAGRETVRFSSGFFSHKLTSLLTGATALTLLWASHQGWRNLVKALTIGILKGHIPDTNQLLQLLPFVSLGCGILFLTRYLYRIRDLTVIRARLPLVLMIAAFLMSFYEVVGYDQYQFKDGAKELAQFVSERHPRGIVVAGFDKNPQLTFYLDGADIGWRNDLEVLRIAPPKERSEFRSWLSEQAGRLPSDVLVVVEKDKFIRYEWVTAEEVNPVDFTLVFDSRRYAVFQRTPSSHLALNVPKLP
jgi:4-amino-4-deoxy-L-arabinose transferase-like glycosyltransferase